MDIGTEPVLVMKDTVVGSRLTASEFHNEIGTLYSLFTGMAFLATQVNFLETTARASPNGRTLGGFFSDLEGYFGLPPGANGLLPCFYHWFGVTTINFVRKAGFLQGVNENRIPRPPYVNAAQRAEVKDYCSRYVSSVDEVKEILIWRNKVFAHFASTDPYGSDNEALLLQVSMYPISYKMGRLTIGSFQVFMGPDAPGDGLDPIASGRSGLPEWSLAEVFGALERRYQFVMEAE